jgi:hypothetical protein
MRREQRPGIGGYAPLASRGAHLTRMPPTRFWSSADLDAAIAQVAPDVLALLGDGVPRAEAVIIAALADRHAKDEVKLTLMRLDVIGRLDVQGGRYTLAAKAEQG